MTVNDESERMYKVKVGLLTWKYSGGEDEKHEGP
jgi:hypothetical protein